MSEEPCLFIGDDDACPCWGEMFPYDDTAEGDGLRVCEGHFFCKALASRDENRTLYRKKETP